MVRKKRKIEKIEYDWSPYQKRIFDFIENGEGNLVVSAVAGGGKCLGKGTEILMYDGTIKKVEDIIVGDLLMGDDSTPRTVLSTTIGNGELCKIIPKKSEPWICNDVHILTIDHYRKKQKNNKVYSYHERVDIAINDLENNMEIDGYKITKYKDDYFRQIKLVKPSVINFTPKELFLHPYLYGAWLGDGTTNEAAITTMDEEIINEFKENIPNGYFLTIHNYGYQGKAFRIIIHSNNTWHNEIRRFLRKSSINKEKFIYHEYLTSSYDERLELLAGLIDTDGYYNGNSTYEICTKYDSLAKNILFLCRSVGLSAYDAYKEKKCHNNGVVGKYHCISISGNVNIIPVRLSRKKSTIRKSRKNNLHEGFKIEHIGNGDFYGFTLDGNGRFLLGDFTITHNTSTLIKCLDFIPQNSNVLFSAFNTDIVNDLKKKIGDLPNVDVRTLHSLGLQFIKRNIPQASTETEPFKYDAYIKNNIRELSSINTYALKSKDYFNYLSNIKKYIDFGRYYLCETVKDLDFIESRYDIETIADEKEIAIDALEWGKNELETIDYTDMIWLPNVLDLKPLGLLYDFIFLDECQDLNKAEREIVLKCFKMGTRMVSVGDEKQCIYSFSGSDPNSFQTLKSIPNTTCLPLSISYRCGKNIVKFANELVKEIQAADNAIDGTVINDVTLDAAKDGDMILCRNNAPLVQVYNEFLKMGKKCYIRGKDVGSNLKLLVKSTKQEKLNVDCSDDGVFVRLYDDLFTTRNKIMEKFGIDDKLAMTSPTIINKLDMINALEILSEGINTSEEIIEKIDSIFPKRTKKDGIMLSTIHKAKGLESENVYIACKSLMPSKSAKKDWEIKQEYNLMYVAYTRAKKTLGFIDEKDFEKFDLTNSNSVATLRRIETKVNQVLSKPTRLIVNKENAKEIVQKAKIIKMDVFKNNNNVKINEIKNRRKVNVFSDFLKNKKTKK